MRFEGRLIVQVSSERFVEEATGQGKKAGVVGELEYECLGMFKLEEVLGTCVKLVTQSEAERNAWRQCKTRSGLGCENRVLFKHEARRG